MAKFVHINSVMRVNLANPNSSEGGGNQITLKKITAFNDKEFVYVSGQAYRRYLRETIYWLTDGEFEICGIDKNGSPIIQDKNTNKPIIENKKINDANLKKQGYTGVMQYIIQNYPELDIFGFLLSISEKQIGALRKTSPLQTTALISSFPYRYNTDMLTRSKATEMGGDIVKVEVDAFNYLQGAQIIHTEMIGSYWDEREEKAIKVLDDNERNKRLSWLLSALQNVMGGAKKARLLTDFSPVLTIATIQKTGVPYFSHKFDILPPSKEEKATSFVDVKGKLNLTTFIETYESIKDYLDETYLGVNLNVFSNKEEIKETLEKEFKDKNITICNSPQEVFEKIKQKFPYKKEEKEKTEEKE
ncbi:MAG: type I-B CRISPR-associated protein Cas7/Cst2/DevR [Candidatus Omnitrophica bacterium 4484_70.2]|nr:MAG: type I-B CRISPR-associated protein Cas7/Cst2/DevR [Candidatus Omnitrophica bacterium 4484_70.2]